MSDRKTKSEYVCAIAWSYCWMVEGDRHSWTMRARKITESWRFVCDSLFSSVGFCLSSARAHCQWISLFFFRQIRCNAQQILLAIISLLWPLHIHAFYFVTFTDGFACGAVPCRSIKPWIFLDRSLATLLSSIFVCFYAVSSYFFCASVENLAKITKKTGFLGSLIHVIKNYLCYCCWCKQKKMNWRRFVEKKNFR